MTPQFHTSTEKAIWQTVYEQALYEVYSEEQTIQLAIGQNSPALDRLIAIAACSCWALITAYNPRSQCLSEAVNQQHQYELQEYLLRRSLISLPAIGKDPKGVWMPEPSRLILGIESTQTTSIGRRFQQNAIVYGEIGQPAKLLWIDYGARD
ncbi:MAG: DUF3293 domain-containing protein [Cyanobacteria bacterium J06623_7]